MNMHNLTWNEFKEKVEKQLDEKGISWDEDIWYIDISFPRNVDVEVDKNSGISISE